MDSFVRVSLGVLVCYGVYCLLLFLFQRTLIYPRHMLDVSASQESREKGMETWWLETGSGKIEAWFFPTPLRGKGGRSPAIIFAHGNAEIIDYWPRDFQKLVAEKLLHEVYEQLRGEDVA